MTRSGHILVRSGVAIAVTGAGLGLAGEVGAATGGQRLIASGGSADDHFGQDVAMSGSTLVVGDPGATVGGRADRGAAYVFTKSGTSWSQVAELTGDPGAGANDEFGTAVAIAAGTIVVAGGAGGGNSYVQVFKGAGASWAEVDRFIDPGKGNDFGAEVAVSGSLIAVSAPDQLVDKVADAGRVYIFERSGPGWSAKGNVEPSPPAGSEFGEAVAVAGSLLAVGSNASADAPATVDLYTQSGRALSQSATVSDPSGNDPSDLFGTSLSLSGSTLLAGAQGADAGAGAAYLFSESGSTWTRSATLTASDASLGKAFGYAVALSGATAVASTPHGEAYVFTESGTSWHEVAERSSPSSIDSQFGFAVALSGRSFAVGAPDASVGSNADQGAVIAYYA